MKTGFVNVLNRLRRGFANLGLLRLLGCGLLLCLASCERDEPPPSSNVPWEIELTGSNFQWEVTDPGRDGKLGTADDLHSALPLRIPANTRTRLLLRSRDFLYTFELPAQQIREIAIPDRTYTVEFHTGKPRQTEFRGDQLCGYAHTALSGAILIQGWRDYRRWQAAAASQQPPPALKNQLVISP